MRTGFDGKELFLQPAAAICFLKTGKARKEHKERTKGYMQIGLKLHLTVYKLR